MKPITNRVKNAIHNIKDKGCGCSSPAKKKNSKRRVQKF